MTPFKEGIQAFIEDKKLSDCPYAIGTKGFKYWRNGFSSAKFSIYEIDLSKDGKYFFHYEYIYAESHIEAVRIGNKLCKKIIEAGKKKIIRVVLVK